MSAQPLSTSFKPRTRPTLAAPIHTNAGASEHMHRGRFVPPTYRSVKPRPLRPHHVTSDASCRLLWTMLKLHGLRTKCLPALPLRRSLAAGSSPAPDIFNQRHLQVLYGTKDELGPSLSLGLSLDRARVLQTPPPCARHVRTATPLPDASSGARGLAEKTTDRQRERQRTTGKS